MSWTFTHRAGLALLALDAPGFQGVDVVVTTRQGGVSASPYDTLNLGDHVGDDPSCVAENRRRVAAAMGVDVEALVITRQEHGTDVARASYGSRPGPADVLATTDPRVAVCILVADCVPIVVCDSPAGVLVVAHAGWRGTAGSVARAAVESARGLGADLDRCHAAIGPSISGRAYQVGDEVASALRAAGCGDAVVPDGPGHFLADLEAANVTQLVAAGIGAARVTGATHVTDGGGRFFSDRAQRPCGRFALAARLTTTGS
jgi:YfiH family protein